MLLDDNKRIQGLFIYSDTAKYEKGDFVVEGECMYICKAANPTDLINNTVSGILPSSDTSNFVPYPGELIATLNEYKDYVANPGGNSIDKYVSSRLLHSILQSAYFGFGDTGVITDYIKKDGSKIKFSLMGSQGNLTATALDYVMRSSTLNNGSMTVSRNLEELGDVIATGGTRDLILRQYTYIDSTDSGETLTNGIQVTYAYRIQELLDAEQGLIYYRSSRGSKRVGEEYYTFGGTITAWRCLVDNASLLNKVNNIIAYYQSSLSYSRTVNSSYMFRDLFTDSATSSYTSWYLILSTAPVTSVLPAIDIKLPSDITAFNTKPYLLTVIVYNSTVSGVYKKYETVIDIKDIWDTSSEVRYYLDEGIALRAIPTNGARFQIELGIVDNTGTTIGTAHIKNIYIKDER